MFIQDSVEIIFPIKALSSATVISLPPFNIHALLTISVFSWTVRTSTAPSTMIGNRSDFIMSDGSIKDIDATSPVNFYDILPGNYYIVLRRTFRKQKRSC